MLQALLDLQGVMVPQHLQTNRTAQAALAGRYRVRMSSFAAELLMRFLHASRMQLLLSLTNEYIELDVRTHLLFTCYPTSEYSDWNFRDFDGLRHGCADVGCWQC